MLEDLTDASFRPHCGSRFHVAMGGQPDLDLELVEVVPYAPGGTAEAKRTPFSLYFRGPASSVLPQRIYRLQHAAMGALDLFLVPIRREGDTLVYEAVFN
ncbi:MAG TPA: hypothetical protein VGE98_00605 [Thermoanaerobaculia bacterium]